MSRAGSWNGRRPTTKAGECNGDVCSSNLGRVFVYLELELVDLVLKVTDPLVGFLQREIACCYAVFALLNAPQLEGRIFYIFFSLKAVSEVFQSLVIAHLLHMEKYVA